MKTLKSDKYLLKSLVRITTSLLSLVIITIIILFIKDGRQMNPFTGEAGDTEIGPVADKLNLPFTFIENQGQWESSVKFFIRNGQMSAWFEPSAFTLQYEGKLNKDVMSGIAVRMSFKNASEVVTITGENRNKNIYHYFVGNESNRWRKNVRSYKQIIYNHLYDGIDVRFRDQNGHLEYDLLLNPSIDPGQIIIQCEGITGLRIEQDGSLLMDTDLGPIIQRIPTTWYQLPDGSRKYVNCQFRIISEFQFGFEVPGFSPDYAMVIDPGLEWSTFIGGSDNETPHAMVLDSDGTLIVTGPARSSDFPTTVGAYDPTQNGANDVFVARLDPNQTGVNQLVWSTYIGGEGVDRCFELALDNSGNITISGSTESSDFPTTPGAYDTTFGGGTRDGFIACLNSMGSSLLLSTYLGSSGDDWIAGMVLDSSDKIVVSGYTGSTNFPTTPGAFDLTYNGGDRDAFLSLLDSSGNSLLYSTFLGGSSGEGSNFGPPVILSVMDIEVNIGGVITVAGFTWSSNFPTTSDAFDRTFNSVGNYSDVFITRLNPLGTGANDLIYSTFFGGAEREFCQNVEISEVNIITFGGTTRSVDLPVTPGAFDPTHNSVGNNDMFLAQLDLSKPPSEQLKYSTYIGGLNNTNLYTLQIHHSGALAFGGGAYENFPTTANSYDSTYNGGFDAVIAILNPVGQGHEDLLYSSYIGGSAEDENWRVIHDKDSILYLCGIASSNDFPTTSGAYDTTFNGGARDVFVAKLIIEKYPPLIQIYPDSFSVTLQQDTTESETLLIVNPGNILTEKLHFEIKEIPVVDWLDVTPSSDTLNGGDSINVFLTFSTDSLQVGSYNVDLELTSNDPSSDTILVPVQLTVSPISNINNVAQISERFILYQNYPNPFNPVTIIEFDLPKTTRVCLKVYNILGEEVATLLSASLHPGSHSVEWNASNLSSGVFLYRLEAGDYVQTRKMVLMK
jgi:hypothetical protein